MDNSFLLHYLGVVAQAADGIDKDLEKIKNNNTQLKTAVNTLVGILKFEYDFPDESATTVKQTLQEVQTQLIHSNTEYLDLTEKEISKMPKQFRKEFRTNNLRAHVRKRTRGNSTSFEIRCRKGGLNITATGSTLDEAKLRFIQKLNDFQNSRGMIAPNVPTTFDKFTMFYFENFRKRKVAEKTFKNDMWRYNKHILPHFGSIRIKDIPPQMCQVLIDKLEAVSSKTAEEIFSLLNCIFKMAIKHNIIVHNPIDVVIHTKHEREHGKALLIDEEKCLLNEASEPYKTIFAIFLYTGIRPNEYATIRIEGNMIYARNSKRHNGKEETKRIPVTPMLKPYVNADTAIPKRSIDTIRDKFNEILDRTHKLYDLRTTFYTRCKMCEIAPAARAEFMGHNISNDEQGRGSASELDRTYTDLPDEYLIQEGQKLDY